MCIRFLRYSTNIQNIYIFLGFNWTTEHKLTVLLVYIFVLKNAVTTSKWENSPQILEKNTNQHLGPWTNKHWETGDKVEIDESVNKEEKKVVTAKTQGPNSISILQRLRVIQEDSSKNEVHLNKDENSPAAVIDNKEKLENSVAASNETTSIPTVPTMIKPQVPPISKNQVCLCCVHLFCISNRLAVQIL